MMRFTVHSSPLVLLVLCFLAPSPHLLPRACAAAALADLEALKQLFQKDPATAFEKSWKLFQEPGKKGDLEGMMAIFRVVAPEAERCYYAKVLDDMVDAGVTLANDRGDWKAKGELYFERAVVCDYSCTYFSARVTSDYARCLHYCNVSREAYERAGATIPESARSAYSYMMSQKSFWVTKLEEDRRYIEEKVPKYAPGILAMGQAQMEGRDAEAVAIASQVLQQLAQETDGNVVGFTLSYIWEIARLRGAECLLPGLLRRGLDPMVCVVAWDGRNGIFQQLCYQAARSPSTLEWSFALKLDAFGRKAERPSGLCDVIFKPGAGFNPRTRSGWEWVVVYSPSLTHPATCE